MKKLMFLMMLIVAPVLAIVSDGESVRQSFTTNGSTTTFTFTFKCNSSDDVLVYSPVIATGLPIAALVEDTDYTIAPTGGSYLNGGVVTISPALEATVALRIVRRIKQSQETAQGAITPTSIVTALDKLTRQVQDAEDRRGRSLRIPESDSVAFDMTLPNAIDRAGKVPVFDESGNIGVTTGTDTFTVVNGVYETITTADLITKGPWIDVRAFGATGDGSTDDTTAIRAAETAAATANAVVYFPPGTYKITGVLATTARAYVGDGGDGTKTVIKQFTADTAIFEYADMRFRKFEGLSFDADVDGVYAFKQTTADAYTDFCIWKECYFATDIERCISANLINCSFIKTRFGYDGTVNGNGIHQAIFSHGTAARDTNANDFYACTFAHGKGGNGYIDISRGISWQFYSCNFEVLKVAAVYALDMYALSFSGCYFEQRIELDSGQDYLIFLGSDGIRDTKVVTFEGVFIILTDNVDINHFIEIDDVDTRVAFGKGGFMALANKDLTNFAGAADVGILSIDSIEMSGFGDQAKRQGYLRTGNIVLRAIEAEANTLMQSLDFANLSFGQFADFPFASIQVETSDTGNNFDSSEMTFHTIETQAKGMQERLRIDNTGLVTFSQATGGVVLFTHQEDSLADDGTVSLPDATSGMVFVSCNAEAGMWLVQADGTVTKIAGSTNTAATDSDTDLCVFDGGTRGTVRNRLGATGEIRIFYYHN